MYICRNIHDVLYIEKMYPAGLGLKGKRVWRHRRAWVPKWKGLYPNFAPVWCFVPLVGRAFRCVPRRPRMSGAPYHSISPNGLSRAKNVLRRSHAKTLPSRCLSCRLCKIQVIYKSVYAKVVDEEAREHLKKMDRLVNQVRKEQRDCANLARKLQNHLRVGQKLLRESSVTGGNHCEFLVYFDFVGTNEDINSESDQSRATSG